MVHDSTVEGFPEREGQPVGARSRVVHSALQGGGLVNSERARDDGRRGRDVMVRRIHLRNESGLSGGSQRGWGLSSPFRWRRWP